MPLLTCKNLYFAYGGETVLSDVSFSLFAGDYLCIVGENGSGKSTLVKGLLGLKSPLSGTIRFSKELEPSEVGYLPQQAEYQKDFPASVFEVALSGRLKKKSLFYSAEDKKITLSNLELMGMSELKNSCFHSLSGGQQRRVLLTRSLNAAGKLLLLDEPTAGLDPAATASLYSLISKINTELSMSVIMVSHDIRAAIKYSTHILHLGNKMLYFGKTADYILSDIGKSFLGGAANV